MKAIARTNWLVYALMCAIIGCRGPTDTVADLLSREIGAAGSMADSATGGATADSATGGATADSATAGSMVDASADSRDAFCQGRNTWIAVPERQGTALTKPVCLGQLASQTFRHGICSCKDAQFTSDSMYANTVITTGAFDSSNSSLGKCGEATTPGGSALGVNETLSVTGMVTLGGGVVVAGAGGVVISPAVLSIQGDLRVRGPFNFIPTEVTAQVAGGATSVEGDMWLGGGLLGLGFLSIDGNLRQAAGAERSPSVMITYLGGRDSREPVSVPSPCACEDSELLDIAGIVADAKSNNHNQEANFNSQSLENVSGNKTVELPCGRIYVSTVNVTGSLVLSVNGRSALFVGGDLSSKGTFSVRMSTDATLDVFVGGNLSLAGLQMVGQQTRPSKLRVYVAQRVDLSGSTTTFAGNFYAPRAEVAVIGDMQTVCGAIFAGKFITSGTLNSIWYDISVLQEGDKCVPPTELCTSNDDCRATSACINGRCSECRSDGDCWEPLVCSQGQCYAKLL